MTSVQDPLIPDEDPEYSVHFPTFALETVCICGIPLTYRRKDTATLLVYALGSFLSLVLVFCITAWCLMAPPIAAQPRGVILMISDGFGPASQTMARNFAQYSGNLSASFQMPLDTILVGSSRTRSSSSLVTDSAAGATAFSCALKSYNGAIAVDPQGRACGTVLEAAKALGMVTALVATRYLQL